MNSGPIILFVGVVGLVAWAQALGAFGWLWRNARRHDVDPAAVSKAWAKAILAGLLGVWAVVALLGYLLGPKDKR